MADQITNLEAVLTNPSGFSWKHSVYATFDETWRLSTQCVICDPDEEAGSPVAAKALGYERVLSIGDFDMIRSNAIMQKPDVTPKELLDAFLHYYDNDSYINFTNTP